MCGSWSIALLKKLVRLITGIKLKVSGGSQRRSYICNNTGMYTHMTLSVPSTFCLAELITFTSERLLAQLRALYFLQIILLNTEIITLAKLVIYSVVSFYSNISSARKRCKQFQFYSDVSLHFLK